MPVYEFVCKDCGTEFEITCHWDERDEQAVCPNCHGKNVETRITSFACDRPKSW
jgi:putative FmdB family regulatory protein